MQVSAKAVSARALQALRSSSAGKGGKDFRLELIAMALHGGKVSFEKVIKMIDDMVALLGKEQIDDEEKELNIAIEDLEKAIADHKGTIATLTEELAALADGIKELDKSVAEATEQRKEEH